MRVRGRPLGFRLRPSSRGLYAQQKILQSTIHTEGPEGWRRLPQQLQAGCSGMTRMNSLALRSPGALAPSAAELEGRRACAERSRGQSSRHEPAAARRRRGRSPAMRIPANEEEEEEEEEGGEAGRRMARRRRGGGETGEKDGEVSRKKMEERRKGQGGRKEGRVREDGRTGSETEPIEFPTVTISSSTPTKPKKRETRKERGVPGIL
eukprot:GHVT01000678.1.p1 GENE.GHVT01000678.1~~GHVT01000678.1.p1  ORF type:complete len:208 (-),score=33.69 GHVT01000678.1:23-646(-)